MAMATISPPSISMLTWAMGYSHFIFSIDDDKMEPSFSMENLYLFLYLGLNSFFILFEIQMPVEIDRKTTENYQKNRIASSIHTECSR